VLLGPGLKAWVINLSSPRLLGVLNDDMALSDWLAPGERPRGSLWEGSEVRKVFRHKVRGRCNEEWCRRVPETSRIDVI